MKRKFSKSFTSNFLQRYNQLENHETSNMLQSVALHQNPNINMLFYYNTGTGSPKPKSYFRYLISFVKYCFQKMFKIEAPIMR